jgi:5-methylcytosine-specific restriction endonuclease McrA
MIDSAIRKLVRERAQNRCEYCHIHQNDELHIDFHIEHIVARQHSGGDEPSNLALACHHCNRRKGPNLTAIDPHTNQIARLFNPREQKWEEHFISNGAIIVGTTPVGRATVRLLQINAVRRIKLRSFLG